MQKLTKSLPIFKERNCTASFVLDTRTHRRNVTEYPLAIRFTVDRKIFYHQIGGTYTEKRFSDISNATRSGSDNYKEQKIWRDTYSEKYHQLIVALNKGGTLTYEMVRTAVVTGNATITPEGETVSFLSVWKEYIHDLMTKDNGARYSTGESHECSLKSWIKTMGESTIRGFNISAAEVQKWKDCMCEGVPGKTDKAGKPLGKIGETSEEQRRKLCLQENSNLRDRMERICHEALGWDISIKPTSTWARHSFATNLRNAGVEIEYISESMGHSVRNHAITQIYINSYPLEKQFEYNSKLLNLPKPKTQRQNLLDKLSTLSEEEIAKLLASIT